MNRSVRFLSIAIIALLVAASLRFGSTDGWSAEILRDFRLPRTVLAFAVGGALALSGLILQLLFFNPLCEPYTLGLASGGTLGMIVAQTLLVPFAIPLSYHGLSPGAIFGTALFGVLLLFTARNARASPGELLLTGVMLSFLGSSLVTLWMLLQDPAQVQSTLSYLFGDLSRAETPSAVLLLILDVVVAIGLFGKRDSLDALLLGEDIARTSGVDVDRARAWLLGIVTLLVALAVSAAGMIGFVGLMVPFFVRRRIGALHGVAVPFCLLWGGGLLVGADLIARTIVRPYELPVGVVTSILGAPFFLWAYRAQNVTGTGGAA